MIKRKRVNLSRELKRNKGRSSTNGAQTAVPGRKNKKKRI